VDGEDHYSFHRLEGCHHQRFFVSPAMLTSPSSHCQLVARSHFFTRPAFSLLSDIIFTLFHDVDVDLRNMLYKYCCVSNPIHPRPQAPIARISPEMICSEKYMLCLHWPNCIGLHSCPARHPWTLQDLGTIVPTVLHSRTAHSAHSRRTDLISHPSA
jgi:hypothetical protein